MKVSRDYTHKDVEYLVDITRVLVLVMDGGSTISPSVHSLRNALEPFRDDPDEKLIEAMAVVMHEAAEGHGSLCKPEFCPICKRQAKAALVVVREREQKP